MPIPAEPVSSPRLVDMDLRIGQTVQLITQESNPRKYYVPLIGFVEREFIMLRVPQENGWAVPINTGQSLDVRIFCGVSLFDFVCRLQNMLHHPRNYMLLTCPTVIRQTRLRSHERAKCILPVQVVQAPLGQGQWSGYQFHDLSGSGAALVGPQALGEPGQKLRIQLQFHLSSTDTQESLELDADIQTLQPMNNQSGQTVGYHHGVHFDKVDPRILLLVNELQKTLPR